MARRPCRDKFFSKAMYNDRQKQILAEITQGLGLPAPGTDAVQVEQSPSYIDSAVETVDFAVTLMGSIGSAVTLIGERRGLGTQRVKVDRRHAALLFNEVAYFFKPAGNLTSATCSPR